MMATQLQLMSQFGHKLQAALSLQVFASWQRENCILRFSVEAELFIVFMACA